MAHSTTYGYGSYELTFFNGIANREVHTVTGVNSNI